MFVAVSRSDRALFRLALCEKLLLAGEGKRISVRNNAQVLVLLANVPFKTPIAARGTTLASVHRAG
jgi:hypothetical protein